LILKAGSNFQDGCIMHGYADVETIVEENASIGHGAVLHGCVIGRNVLIGMNSVVMDGAVVGAESIVAAMSFVKAGFKGEARQMLVGSPAQVLRAVTDQDMSWQGLNVREYQALAGRSARSMREVRPLAEMEGDRSRLAGVTDVVPKHEMHANA
jgi:carnitine operon protein CaiE